MYVFERERNCRHETNRPQLCVVPIEAIRQNPGADIASLFFQIAFGTDNAKRIMQGAIALAILGNIVVMTFTAARVKMEIAKEGILPFSLTFATGRRTLIAWLRSKFTRTKVDQTIIDPLEQSPIAALCLHWCSSMLLLAVTAGLKVDTAYTFLIALYSYTMIVFISFWVATALIYMKLSRRVFVSGFNIAGPLPAIIYWFVTLFVLVTAFIKPTKNIKPSYPYFLVPVIGLSTILWGTAWWVGLKLIERWRGQTLRVERKPHVVQDEEEGEYVMKYETIRHVWRISVAVEDSDDPDDVDFRRD